MPEKKFSFERGMAQATKAYEGELAERARLESLRRDRACVRQWYVLTFFLFAIAFALTFQERVSDLLIASWTGGCPTTGASAGTAAGRRRAKLPGLAALDQAKRTIGDAKAVNEKREKLIDELATQGP